MHLLLSNTREPHLVGAVVSSLNARQKEGKQGRLLCGREISMEWLVVFNSTEPHLFYGNVCTCGCSSLEKKSTLAC